MGVDPSQYCVAGSAALTVAEIRQNHDLEVIFLPKTRAKICKANRIKLRIWGHKEFRENIDFFRNMYGVIGFTDRRIFKKQLFAEYGDRRVVTLEMEYLYKWFLLRHMKREKDKNDIEAITPLLNQGALASLKSKRSWIICIFFSLYFDLSLFCNRAIKKIGRLWCRSKHKRP